VRRRLRSLDVLAATATTWFLVKFLGTRFRRSSRRWALLRRHGRDDRAHVHHDGARHRPV